MQQEGHHKALVTLIKQWEGKGKHFYITKCQAASSLFTTYLCISVHLSRVFIKNIKFFILVKGERCNVAGEYFLRGSTSE